MMERKRSPRAQRRQEGRDEMAHVSITSSWLRQHIRDHGGVMNLTMRIVIAG
jgi:hypothetical protein